MRTRMDNRAQVVMESMFPKHPALEEEGVSVIIIIYSVGGNACMSIVEPAVILTNVCIVQANECEFFVLDVVVFCISDYLL